MTGFMLMMMMIIIIIIINIEPKSFNLSKSTQMPFKELMIPSLHDCICLDIVNLNIQHACFGLSLI